MKSVLLIKMQISRSHDFNDRFLFFTIVVDATIAVVTFLFSFSSFSFTSMFILSFDKLQRRIENKKAKIELINILPI